MAGLCHLIPAFFVLTCTAVLFLFVRPAEARLRWLATMVPVAGLLTAFWVAAVLLAAGVRERHGLGEVAGPQLAQDHLDYLTPALLLWAIVLAGVGVRRARSCTATSSGWCSATSGCS